MNPDIKEILITKEQLAHKVKELGARLTQDYAGKELVTICVLKGSVIFYADLIRELDVPVAMDFLSVSSYGNSRKSAGIVQFRMDLYSDIRGKDVLVIEDIMDSGQTLAYLKEVLTSRMPNSFKICTLLDKPSRRVADIQPDYCGFEIPDEFVVGYGLDFAEKYRNLDYIGVLKPAAYETPQETGEAGQ